MYIPTFSKWLKRGLYWCSFTLKCLSMRTGPQCFKKSPLKIKNYSFSSVQASSWKKAGNWNLLSLYHCSGDFHRWCNFSFHSCSNPVIITVGLEMKLRQKKSPSMAKLESRSSWTRTWTYMVCRHSLSKCKALLKMLDYWIPGWIRQVCPAQWLWPLAPQTNFCSQAGIFH